LKNTKLTYRSETGCQLCTSLQSDYYPKHHWNLRNRNLRPYWLD